MNFKKVLILVLLISSTWAVNSNDNPEDNAENLGDNDNDSQDSGNESGEF